MVENVEQALMRPYLEGIRQLQVRAASGQKGLGHPEGLGPCPCGARSSGERKDSERVVTAASSSGSSDVAAWPSGPEERWARRPTAPSPTLSSSAAPFWICFLF